MRDHGRETVTERSAQLTGGTRDRNPEERHPGDRRRPRQAGSRPEEEVRLWGEYPRARRDDRAVLRVRSPDPDRERGIAAWPGRRHARQGQGEALRER